LHYVSRWVELMSETAVICLARGWRGRTAYACGGNMQNDFDCVPREQAVAQATGTVAYVDVRVAEVGIRGSHEAPAATALEFAVRQIQMAVRADDRVCPIGTSLVAVEFGSVANEVLPQVLGDRLARAVVRNRRSNTSSSRLAVSVGIATTGHHLGPSDTTRRALSAAQAGRSHLEQRLYAGTDESTTVVTFDRPLGRRSPGFRSGHVVRSIRRRRLYRYEAGLSSASMTQASSAEVPGQISLVLDSRSAGLTVLVVDPVTSNHGHFGLAATTAASLTERAGCRTALVAFSPDDQLALAVDGVALDLVVLVLDGGTVGCSSAWSSGVWDIAARLASSYRMAAVPVLAISAGAGAGAVASCVANGAHALSSLDRLPEFLRSLEQCNGDGPRHTVDESLPPRFMALVGLTASERRVLYYLTKGWVAQDIAEHLVVSLTTVRSHIRSVLRKLRVRSQLAAVAIANSSDLENLESGKAS